MSTRKKRRQIKINPKVEEIIQEYILEVNQKWNSYVFPSSQLTKIVMNSMSLPLSYYRIYHQMTKQILKKWERQDICQFIETESEISKKREKLLYRFSDNSIRQMMLYQLFPLPC